MQRVGLLHTPHRPSQLTQLLYASYLLMCRAIDFYVTPATRVSDLASGTCSVTNYLECENINVGGQPTD